MDVFEQLVADILRLEGYWVQTNFQVFLSRQDKIDIHRPSCPNWELDLVAYNQGLKRLWAVECKSYLDSGGVHAAMFDPAHKHAGRYKLFNESDLRKVVFRNLQRQLMKSGQLIEEIEPCLALACGHITEFNETKLGQVFRRNKWELLGPSWLRYRFEKMAVGGYQNTPHATIIKLVMNSKPVLDLPTDDPYGWRADARTEVFADRLYSGEIEMPENAT